MEKTLELKRIPDERSATALDWSGCYMSRIIRGASGKLPGNHRAEVILHRGMEYFGEYSSLDQLRDFAEVVGFTWTLHHSERMELELINGDWNTCEPYTVEYYTLSHDFAEASRGGFWSLDDLPANVVPFVGLSNGGLVRCYAANDNGTITLYRPNPNAKAVYTPLALAEHIAYRKAHGDMGPITYFISGPTWRDPETWADAPDRLEKLLANLKQYPLDPTFEAYGDFVELNPEWIKPEAAKKYAGCTKFWGNFYGLSGVFDIITNNPRIIAKLIEAIRRNQATAEYAAAKKAIAATLHTSTKED